MGNAHELGRQGEALAAALLEAGGWRIVARNFRFRRKEIDLIARRGNVVAFIEVKTRAGHGYGHPLEAVTWAKRREIETVARAWVARYGHAMDLYRFDTVAVVCREGEPPRLLHVEDAWRL
ncbi:MAG TPA: YraN family protein [Longimicrobiales bacterium]